VSTKAENIDNLVAAIGHVSYALETLHRIGNRGLTPEERVVRDLETRRIQQAAWSLFDLAEKKVGGYTAINRGASLRMAETRIWSFWGRRRQAPLPPPPLPAVAVAAPVAAAPVVEALVPAARRL
jgi:hypothetical protein